jgi:RNA polymerase sigma factor (TIGR02999 family)
MDPRAPLDDGALFTQLYARLHRLAERHFADKQRAHTLQPTALIHEVYLKLMNGDAAAVTSRTHFFRLAARMMRQILLDHARARGAKRRGGERRRVTLSGVEPIAAPAGAAEEIDVERLDDALRKLELRGPAGKRQAEIVELRFFAGLSEDEAAAERGISARTARADWRVARAWLRRELERERAP